MVIKKGNDLILKLDDITDVVKIHIYTTYVDDYIEKKDISNKINVSAKELSKLNSGVITYDAYKSKEDSSFGDDSYDTIETVVTDIYYLDTDESGAQHKKSETVEEYVDKKIDGFEQEIEEKTKEISDSVDAKVAVKAKEIADTVDSKIKVETDRATNAETTLDNKITNLTNNKADKSAIPTKVSQLTNDSGFITDISGKQDKLVSGTNIKTINNETILGEGNINIEIPNMTVNEKQIIINKTNTASGNKIALVGINNTTSELDECLVFGNDNSTIAKRSVIMGRNNSVSNNDSPKIESFHPYIFGASNVLKDVSNSYVMGYSNNIYGASESLFIGNYCNYDKVNQYSAFFGFNNTCSGNNRSVSIGVKNTSTNIYQSVICGISNNNQSNSYSTAVGYTNTMTATDENHITQSTAVGAKNTINSSYSTAVGYCNTTNNSGETAIGIYNLSETDVTSFSVGNGSYIDKTIKGHNLLMGKRNGDLYIVEKTPTDDSSILPYEAPMKRLQTWLNEKADLNNLDNYEKKITSKESSDTAIELTPNTNVDITCSGDLTITLQAPTDTSIVNVYMCTITTSGDSGTVTLPSDITWNEEMTIEASSFYEINIRYSGGSYFGIIHKWSN